MGTRPPFEKAGIIEVPLQQDGYVDTALLDLVEIIGGVVPHIDLIQILPLEKNGWSSLIVIDGEERVIAGCIYRLFNLCQVIELRHIAVKADC